VRFNETGLAVSEALKVKDQANALEFMKVKPPGY